MICSCIILIGKSRISCRFFTLISFSLCLFLLFWSIQNANLQFSIFPLFLCFYFLERAESNDKFFSKNQEVILAASLVGFCLIVIVGFMLYLFKRRVLLRQKT